MTPVRIEKLATAFRRALRFDAHNDFMDSLPRIGVHARFPTVSGVEAIRPTAEGGLALEPVVTHFEPAWLKSAYLLGHAVLDLGWGLDAAAWANADPIVPIQDSPSHQRLRAAMFGRALILPKSKLSACMNTFPQKNYEVDSYTIAKKLNLPESFVDRRRQDLGPSFREIHDIQDLSLSISSRLALG